ncbi:hypothetical protein DOTSEDRAFT_57272 [Dothistroma septosporum NZE10]|uniref:F-box domain-containing protein n=1 Tax=Dothistroma septosporum (strain NZE10 / CBS 128990) TaxID=675120 RepID=M2YJ70_DOTSN|nr:hypothetical protein DOTSEDRAFT_57272 [Dothistroma septosporum NZE10]
MTAPRLSQLPEELLQIILERLRQVDLYSLNQASRWCYQVATPFIWRSVELMDCKTIHDDGVDDHDDTPVIRKLLLFIDKPEIAACVQTLTHRCHLPPPAIFQELPYVAFSASTLSADPRTIELVKLAAKQLKNVNTLRIVFGHPNLTDALLRCFFDVKRTGKGAGCARIRKLWLENCRISNGLCTTLPLHPYGLPLALDLSGLESVRFRRLPIRPRSYDSGNAPTFMYNYSRDGSPRLLQDGCGGMYTTATTTMSEEFKVGREHVLMLGKLQDVAQRQASNQEDRSQLLQKASESAALDSLFARTNVLDDRIYKAISSKTDLPLTVRLAHISDHHTRAVTAYRGTWLDPDSSTEMADRPWEEAFDANDDDVQIRSVLWEKMQREKLPSSDVAIVMLQSVGNTLTSLNLDWVLSIPHLRIGASKDTSFLASWSYMFLSLFECRFPHLRSFQLRNGVVPDTILPPALYLLDRSFTTFRDPTNATMSRNIDAAASFDLAGLRFMEAHPNIQCLAWPMDHFFSPRQVASDIKSRVEAVIDNLGRTLTELRIDSIYSGSGEVQTEETWCDDTAARDSRRRFITDFASKMTALKTMKVEGGMPRDERREVFRAVHVCALTKIVMIGVCSPLGNSWGLDGPDAIEVLREEEPEGLEAEDKATVFALGTQKLQPPSEDFVYTPQWECKGLPPMMHTLASYHADTVRELKFCGYKGSSILFSPTPITSPLLSSMKHFHNLESIILSMWLTTQWEGTNRDNEVISYWNDMRSPASTAVVLLTDEEPEGWERELKTKYKPDALAWRITNFIGPYLSEIAKQRKGGVHVRASFCIGECGIFDVDIAVGKGALNSDICLRYEGPREEMEPERRKAKLDARGWF